MVRQRVRRTRSTYFYLISATQQGGRRCHGETIALFFVPGEAFSHHFHFAATALRFHENGELSVSSFALKYRRGGRNQIAALLRPTLCFEVCGQFGTGALHVRLALESKLFDKPLVLDVRRIFGECQILGVQLIFRRLGCSASIEGCRSSSDSIEH